MNRDDIEQKIDNLEDEMLCVMLCERKFHGNGQVFDHISHRLLELVKLKDKALADYSQRMEQKSRELESLVQELDRRSMEQENSLAVLRMYQLIFENEPTAILWCDRDANLVQFNAASIRYFGVGLHSVLLGPVVNLSLPDAPSFNFYHAFHETIGGNGDNLFHIACVHRTLFLRAYRLDDDCVLRGVIFRLSDMREDTG